MTNADDYSKTKKMAKTALLYISLVAVLLFLLLWPYDDGGVATINGFKNKVNINYRYMFLYKPDRDKEKETSSTESPTPLKATVIKSINIFDDQAVESKTVVPNLFLNDDFSTNHKNIVKNLRNSLDRTNSKVIEDDEGEMKDNDMMSDFKNFYKQTLGQKKFRKVTKNDMKSEVNYGNEVDVKVNEDMSGSSKEDEDDYSTESDESTETDPRFICDGAQVSVTGDQEEEDFIDKTFNVVRYLKYSDSKTTTTTTSRYGLHHKSGTDRDDIVAINTGDTAVFPLAASLMSDRVNYNLAHRLRRRFEIKVRLRVGKSITATLTKGGRSYAARDKVSSDQEKYFELAEKLSTETSVNNGAGIDEGEKSFDPWQTVAGWVGSDQVTPERAPLMGTILDVASSVPITGIRVPKKMRGSTMKLIVELEGGQQAIFKPKRLSLEKYVRDRFWPAFHGKERYNCEIAGFHLSRILNFRKTAIVVGRKLHIANDLVPVDELGIVREIEEDDDGNYCFRIRKKKKKLCTTNGMYLEGALILMLPKKLNILKNPWHPKFWDKVYKSCDGRQMFDISKAECKRNIKDSFKSSKKKDQYEVTKGISTLRTLLDVIDTSIYDFLLDNIDRSSFEYMVDDPEDEPDSSSILMIDSGNCFPDPKIDTFTTLAPLYQCCMLRTSTYDRLTLLRGNRLSTLLNVSMSNDYLTPILTEPYFEAISRRLESLMLTIKWCFATYDEKNVLIPDSKIGEPLLSVLF